MSGRDRDCNACVYHTSGNCSKWECEGTVTRQDIYDRAVKDTYKSVQEEILLIIKAGYSDKSAIRMIKDFLKDKLEEIEDGDTL